MRRSAIMNLIEKLKNSISTIYAKYINQNEEIENLPIFYIGGVKPYHHL